MSFGYHNNLNNISLSAKDVNFKSNSDLNKLQAPLAKPIETVQKSIEGSVDAVVQKVGEEKEKKSNKKAIAVGSSIFVLSALVAVLNPKSSSKIMNKLKSWQHSAGNQLEKNKNNYLKSNFHKACAKTLDWGIRTLQFSNNFNSAKDICFKWLCTEKKHFYNVKNKTTRNILQKIDSGFRKFMTKPHQTITKWFDSISQKTVKNNYKAADKKMNKLDLLIQKYKNKLPSEKITEIETKLQEIKNSREYFSNKNIAARLTEQENLMTNLEQDFMKKFNSYKNGFSNKWKNKSDHISNNLTFWAEEILMPTRDKVQQKGLSSVEKLIGNSKDKKGLYDEVIDILSPYLQTEEKIAIEKLLNKSAKKLRQANHSECIQYFDKKRDLVLGGAPTDIVTAIGGLGLSGAAIATADDKEERISRALTGAFPVVAGLGASMAFTAMLFSGVQGMLLGAGTGIGLSKLGSLADHYILGNKETSTKKLTSTDTKPQEVTNA